jgi:DNA-binding transcriptional ArsR family regulator
MTQQFGDVFADLDRLRLPAGQIEVRPDATKKGVKTPKKIRRIEGEFLKGPIPLSWLSVASKLSGKASLAVGLAIWFEAGRRGSNEVRLTTAILSRFGVNRKAKYSGLAALEEAGLIRVRRELRKNPVVTILEVKDDPAAGEQDRDVTGSMPPATADERVLNNENLGGTCETVGV